MDPFFIFAFFTALTPVSNHYAVTTSERLREYEALNITLDEKESAQRAKYMERLLSSYDGKGLAPFFKTDTLDDRFRKTGPEDS